MRYRSLAIGVALLAAAWGCWAAGRPTPSSPPTPILTAMQGELDRSIAALGKPIQRLTSSAIRFPTGSTLKFRALMAPFFQARRIVDAGWKYKHAWEPLNWTTRTSLVTGRPAGAAPALPWRSTTTSPSCAAKSGAKRIASIARVIPGADQGENQPAECRCRPRKALRQIFHTSNPTHQLDRASKSM